MCTLKLFVTIYTIYRAQRLTESICVLQETNNPGKYKSWATGQLHLGPKWASHFPLWAEQHRTLGLPDSRRGEPKQHQSRTHLTGVESPPTWAVLHSERSFNPQTPFYQLQTQYYLGAHVYEERGGGRSEDEEGSPHFLRNSQSLTKQHFLNTQRHSGNPVVLFPLSQFTPVIPRWAGMFRIPISPLKKLRLRLPWKLNGGARTQTRSVCLQIRSS